MNPIVTFIINAILTGTSGITVALLVLQLFRLKQRIDPVIINSVCILLLTGSLIYLLKTTFEFVESSNRSGGNGFAGTRITHPITFTVFLCAWPLAFGLLPQLLWFKRLRQRLSSLIAIVAIWAFTRIFVPWDLTQFLMEKKFDLRINDAFSFMDYTGQGAAYAVAFTLVYSFLSRRANNEKVVPEEPPVVD